MSMHTTRTLMRMPWSDLKATADAYYEAENCTALEGGQ